MNIHLYLYIESLHPEQEHCHRFYYKREDKKNIRFISNKVISVPCIKIRVLKNTFSYSSMNKWKISIRFNMKVLPKGVRTTYVNVTAHSPSNELVLNLNRNNYKNAFIPNLIARIISNATF